METGISIAPEKEFTEALEELPEGFDFVETSIGEMERDPENIDVEEWKEELEQRELDLVVHLPFRQPLATTVEEYNDAKLEYTRRMLELAGELDAEKAVLHANLRYGEEKEELEDTVKSQVELLDSYAERQGIELAVENIPFDDSHVAELQEFGEMIRETGASICLDTGHAFAEKGQEELEKFAEEFSDLITHLHVQDSRGGDDHLAVGHGEIDFQDFLDKLGDFTGTATFEIFSPDYDYHGLSMNKFLD
ncbi:MAG: sugar phosphate isomerase/epimerase family protein [Candidatus Nanohaloarchaea archaeon]